MITTLTPQRKHRKLLKDGSGGEVWPERVERVFVAGLEAYLNSNYATYSRGRSRWRNQFLVDHLRTHGIERTKKQVASHIQVLRNMWKGEPQFYLVAGGAEDEPPSHAPTHHHPSREHHRVSSISPSRGHRSSSLRRVGSPTRQPMSIPNVMGSFGSPENAGSPGALIGLPHSPSVYASPGSGPDIGSPSSIGSPGSVKHEQMSPYGSPIGGASRSPAIKVEDDLLAMDTGGSASVYDSEHVSMYDNVHVFTGLPAADGGLSVLPMGAIEGGAPSAPPDMGLNTYTYTSAFKYPPQPGSGDAYSQQQAVEYSRPSYYTPSATYAPSQFSPQPSLVSDLSDSSMSSTRFSANMSDFQRYSLMSSTSSDAHYQSFGAYNEAPSANAPGAYGALGMYNMDPSAQSGGGVACASGLPAPAQAAPFSGDIYKNQIPSAHAAYYSPSSQAQAVPSQTGSTYAQQPPPPYAQPSASAPSAQQPHVAAPPQHQPRAPAPPASPPATYPLVSAFVVTAPGMQALHVSTGELHAQLAPTAALPGTPLCIKVQVGVDDVGRLGAVQAALAIGGLWTSGGEYRTKVYRSEGAALRVVHMQTTPLVVRAVERGTVHADALAFAGLDLRPGDSITQDIYVDRRPVLMVVYALGAPSSPGASLTAELTGYQLAGRQSQMRQAQQQQQQQQQGLPYQPPQTQQPLTVSPHQLASGSLRRQPAHFDLRNVKREYKGNSLTHALGA